MTMSALCQGSALTNKRYDRLGNQITRITPHQEIAHWTAETAAKWFRDNGLDNSVNYCIGYDGSLWCNVIEEYGAWTSSSAENDRRAITVEISNTEEIYSGKMTDAAIETFINLCVDLIRRYPSLGGKFNYTGNTSGNITLHEWFATTNCPGEWFKAKLPWIQEQVNARLTTGYITKHEVINNFIEGKTKAKIKKLFAPVFDAAYYKNHYQDVKDKSDEDAFVHFLNYGTEEGRQAIATFDPVFYRANYPELKEKHKKFWPCYYVEYLQFGKKRHDVTYEYNFKDNTDTKKAWYKAVLWGYNRGLVLPTKSGNFGLENKTTRKFLALALWRYEGRPTTSKKNPYKDINEKWATWAYHEGYIKGSKKMFNASAALTNGQVLSILWKFAGKPIIKEEEEHASVTVKAVSWAVANKVVRAAMLPTDKCSKKMAMLWLYRAFK